MKLTPDLLIHAYSMGVFPMAESADSAEVQWIDPHARGVLPLDGFRLSRSLARAIRKRDYQICVDVDFAAVIDSCAARPETWINRDIRSGFLKLHEAGFAHSIELRPGGDGCDASLAGGVYGVALGAAFFGESMFSRRRDASKVALAHLVALLRNSGFELFDTQFLTPHLESLGAREIPRREFKSRLAEALGKHAEFPRRGASALTREEVVRTIREA